MMLINIIGLLLIVVIIWWFWLYKSKEVTATDEITIIVENGIYQPSRIKLASGQPVSIHFLRKDATPCSATLLIPELGISEELILNKKTSIRLPAMDKGEYAFHCQMLMYKGTLLVE